MTNFSLQLLRPSIQNDQDYALHFYHSVCASKSYIQLTSPMLGNQTQPSQGGEIFECILTPGSQAHKPPNRCFHPYSQVRNPGLQTPGTLLLLLYPTASPSNLKHIQRVILNKIPRGIYHVFGSKVQNTVYQLSSKDGLLY